jgi:hypothetical protein
MTQLLKIGNRAVGRRVILTCDPFSLRALRDVAPPDVVVLDLLDFAFGQGRGDSAGG